MVQGRRSLLSKRKAKKHSDLPFAWDGGLEDGVQDKVGISETDVNGMLRNGDIAFIEMKYKKENQQKIQKEIKMDVKKNKGNLKDARAVLERARKLGEQALSKANEAKAAGEQAKSIADKAQKTASKAQKNRK